MSKKSTISSGNHILVEVSDVACTILLCQVGNFLETLSFSKPSWILMSSPSFVSEKVVYGYILNGQSFNKGNVADGSASINQRPALTLKRDDGKNHHKIS